MNYVQKFVKIFIFTLAMPDAITAHRLIAEMGFSA